MATTAVSTSQVAMLALDVIVPSKTNRVVKDSDVSEMAASIKQHGVLEPIVVRPKGQKFELVFGERRWRGARAAGLAEIPTLVRDYSDEEAKNAQLVENLHRTDLAPMDEARGYAELLKLRKDKSIQSLAESVDKTAGHVERRLKLLDLIEAAATALRREQITVKHALLLAPLTAEQQKNCMTFLLRGMEGSVKTGNDYSWLRVTTAVPADVLLAYIERSFMLSLAKAPFDIKDAKLTKIGACTTCQFNTGTRDALFPNVAEATCTMPKCYYEKKEAALVQIVAKVKQETGAKRVFRLGVGSEYQNKGVGQTKVDGYLVTDSYRSGPRIAIGKGECKSAVPAVLVFKGRDEKGVTANIGAITSICDDSKCPKHGNGGTARGDASSSTRQALSGMAFVRHKKANLKRSFRERFRAAVYAALCKEVLTIPALGPGSNKQWQERIDWVSGDMANNLGHDNARDAAKALGLWDRKKKSSEMDWRATLAKHFAGKPWSYMLAILAATDIRNDRTAAQGSNLFLLAASYKIDVEGIRRELTGEDKTLISGMAKRAQEREKTKAKSRKVAKAKPGRCRYCKCTEEKACNPPCSWVDKAQTVCSNPACVVRGVEDGVLKKAG